MATSNQPFNVLANSLRDLFKSYDQLEESLKSLSKDVFKIRVDSQSAAVDISVFSETTRMNLVSYLTSVRNMSTAMLNEDLEACKFQAIVAKTFMTRSLNSDVKEVNADRMLEAVESVIELLRGCEESKQQVSEAVVEKLITDASTEANNIIKGFIVGLLQKIKEEISKAIDDSKLLKNSSDLEKEVEKVKQAVTDVKNSCEENLSALDEIISSISEPSAKERGCTAPFEGQCRDCRNLRRETFLCRCLTCLHSHLPSIFPRAYVEPSREKRDSHLIICGLLETCF